jgi:uncharacterized protein with HEPN domain
MLSNKARSALFDIRHNILAAESFTTGLFFEEFKHSELHFYAVMRALGIISEASRRLPESFREKHAALPWKQIKDIGNVLRREYDDSLEAMVWEIVRKRLAPLLAVVAAEIAAFESE